MDRTLPVHADWGTHASKRRLGRATVGPAGHEYLEHLSGVTVVNVLEGQTRGQRLRRYNERAAEEVWDSG